MGDRTGLQDWRRYRLHRPQMGGKHPDHQGLAKKLIDEHVKAEEAVGCEIFPAAAGMKVMSEAGREADASK